MWRYEVEGGAYELAERCGWQVGLGVELLMATEADMCTSGLAASVAPWKTMGVGGGGAGDGDGGGGENAAVGRRGVGGGLVALGVAVVVGGVVGGL